MKKSKYKEFIKEIITPFRPFDIFTYLMLVIFVVLVFTLKLNFILSVIFAIIFSIIIFFNHIFQLKFSNMLFGKKYIDEIENLDLESLKKIMKIYYQEREYKVNQEEQEIFIEKNKNRYKLIFFTTDFNIQNLKKITKGKTNEQTIIITNKDITKEERNYIKEKKFYSISKNGLMGILKEQKYKIFEEENI